MRLLPTDPPDTVPSAVRWAYAVEAAIRDVPLASMRWTSRPSLVERADGGMTARPVG